MLETAHSTARRRVCEQVEQVPGGATAGTKGPRQQLLMLLVVVPSLCATLLVPPATSLDSSQEAELLDMETRKDYDLVSDE